MKRKIVCSLLFSLLVVSMLLQSSANAQRRKGASGIVSGVSWSKDGKSLSYATDGQRYLFKFETGKKTKVETAKNKKKSGNNRPSRKRRFGRTRGTTAQGNTGRYLGRPTRGRQYTQVVSPDGIWEANYKNWNVVLKNTKTNDEVNVTIKGNENIHYGTASWVYGEELGQRKAMWWTPDSKKLLYYKFDDTLVEKFYLLRGWTNINTKLYPEYYAKAGAKNPVSELWIYDLESQNSVRVDAGGSGDEYIYGIRVSPDNKVMMLNWTDRLQRHLKVLAIDVATGKVRTIVEEKQETWQTNSPRMTYLKDKNRFLWPSDKTGYTHYELRNLQGQKLNQVTHGEFQILRTQLMESDKLVNFVANSSKKNPYYNQFHLVGIDGKNQRRVTSLDFHHSNFNLSPDRKWLVAQYEEVNTPPRTALYKTDGTFVANLAVSNPKNAANVAEMFKFRSDDDKYDIYGILYKPTNFDPNKKYPVINALYGGPGSREISARYISRTRPECSRGYLVVKVNNRGTGERGKAFLTATYGKLGDVDIQDHADAIRFLRKRPYFDGKRVGITGSSYGGYMSAIGIFKHPDVYAAAVDKSGPTDWRNYDTIYTERYMSTPQLNKKGYDVGKVMTYVKDFKGKIFIMHGMMDDNVHPNNAFQLIDAMDRAGKSYESRFWPNGGHGLGRGRSQSEREFFDRVLQPGRPTDS